MLWKITVFETQWLLLLLFTLNYVKEELIFKLQAFSNFKIAYNNFKSDFKIYYPFQIQNLSVFFKTKKF